jgi:hypothetical protein
MGYGEIENNLKEKESRHLFPFVPIALVTLGITKGKT